MAFERHSWLEHGRPRSGEAESQSGVDDARFDEAGARLSQEKVEKDQIEPNHRSGQTGCIILDLSQVDVVAEIVRLQDAK